MFEIITLIWPVLKIWDLSSREFPETLWIIKSERFCYIFLEFSPNICKKYMKTKILATTLLHSKEENGQKQVEGVGGTQDPWFPSACNQTRMTFNVRWTSFSLTWSFWDKTDLECAGKLQAFRIQALGSLWAATLPPVSYL